MKKTLLFVFIAFITNGILSQETKEEKKENIKSINLTEKTSKDVPFRIIEEAPIHPNCEGLSLEKDKRRCLNTMMIKHVQKHFNIGLAKCIEKKMIYNKKYKRDELRCIGLSPGKKRIYIQFKIDYSGEIVSINVRAPHPKLEKEGERIAKLIPKMIPGKQKGEPVRVGYTLPITFNVD